MRLHTEVLGPDKGYPALCLHGHPGSGRALEQKALPQAEIGFRTYAPDLRGYGRSRTQSPFDMTRHLDDLEELLAQHSIERCLVVGWSLGGILTMELALRRPEVVQGMVLVGTAARPRGSHPPISLMDNVMTGLAGLVNWVMPGGKGAIALGKKSLFRYLICNHTKAAYRYLAAEGAPAVFNLSRHADAALIRAIRAGYNRVPDLRGLTMPSVMLCGECDRHITAESSLETARALPNSKVHCYPNTAHLFPWEIPTQVNEDIRSWLVLSDVTTLQHLDPDCAYKVQADPLS